MYTDLLVYLRIRQLYLQQKKETPPPKKTRAAYVRNWTLSLSVTPVLELGVVTPHSYRSQIHCHEKMYEFTKLTLPPVVCSTRSILKRDSTDLNTELSCQC